MIEVYTADPDRLVFGPGGETPVFRKTTDFTPVQEPAVALGMIAVALADFIEIHRSLLALKIKTYYGRL